MIKNKITVITVCLNEELNIKKTMESICLQDYDEIEYIIKDGMSTDKTNVYIDEIIKKYRDTKLEIKHIVSEDLGIYDAMNQALKYCTGTWVIFINSGDMFSKENILSNVFLNRCFDLYDVLFGDTIVKDFAGQSVWKADVSKITSNMPFSHQSCFFRVNAIMEYGFDSNKYKIAADYDLLIKLYKRNCEFHCVNEIISIFNLDGISSTDYVSKLKEHRQVLYHHNYINKMKGINFYVKLVEAIIKTFIDKYVPKKWSKNLRKWYKRWIKCYQDLN